MKHWEKKAVVVRRGLSEEYMTTEGRVRIDWTGDEPVVTFMYENQVQTIQTHPDTIEVRAWLNRKGLIELAEVRK